MAAASSTRERLIPVLDHVGFAIGVLVLFYATHLLAPNTIPTPIAIVEAFVTQVEEGALVDATIQALYAIVTGFLISVIIGIGIGLFMGLNWHVEQFFDPYVNSLYVLPVSALVPAFIIWFGTGFEIRVFVVVLFATFPILINTLEGVRETPPELIAAARSFGANRRFVIRHVVLPHEIPYITAGLRLGIGRAVKGLVITELIVSVTGFGLIIARWSSASSLEGVFSVVLVLMTIGVVSTWLMGVARNRLVHWDISETE